MAFDGVFSGLEGVDVAHPHRLLAPTDQDLEQVVEQVHARVVVRLLKRRRLLPYKRATPSEDPFAAKGPALAACYATAIKAPRKLDADLFFNL